MPPMTVHSIPIFHRNWSSFSLLLPCLEHLLSIKAGTYRLCCLDILSFFKSPGRAQASWKWSEKFADLHKSLSHSVFSSVSSHTCIYLKNIERDTVCLLLEFRDHIQVRESILDILTRMIRCEGHVLTIPTLLQPVLVRLFVVFGCKYGPLNK